MGNTTTKRKRAPQDQEVLAIAQIVKILDSVTDPISKHRIVNYVGSRLSVPSSEDQGNGQVMVGGI